MPSLIDLRRRIRAVKNTQQITKAMKMVAASKLRRAQERIMSARPYATQMQRVLASSRAGDVFPRMVAEVAAGSALGRAYLQRVIGPRFAMVDSILARGVRRGELSADLDLDVARDLLVGPVVVAKLTGRLTPRAAPQRAAQLVDTLLGGLATSAPGRPPSRRDRKGDLS